MKGEVEQKRLREQVTTNSDMKAESLKISNELLKEQLADLKKKNDLIPAPWYSMTDKCIIREETAIKSRTMGGVPM